MVTRSLKAVRKTWQLPSLELITNFIVWFWFLLGLILYTGEVLALHLHESFIFSVKVKFVYNSENQINS
jgi:hypothetical protein